MLTPFHSSRWVERNDVKTPELCLKLRAEMTEIVDASADEIENGGNSGNCAHHWAQGMD
jgi:hypothetical protein